MKTMIKSVLIIGSVLFGLASSQAQNYVVDSFKIGGGGGTSIGGVYSLSGTAGQHDAGSLDGGEFSVVGGFWGTLVAVPGPGAPALTISLSATNTVIISWPSSATGFVLQQNPDLNTTGWANAPQPPIDDGTTVSVVISPPAGSVFYRLKH